jgi:hypothetical protein
VKFVYGHHHQPVVAAKCLLCNSHTSSGAHDRVMQMHLRFSRCATRVSVEGRVAVADAVGATVFAPKGQGELLCCTCHGRGSSPVVQSFNAAISRSRLCESILKSAILRPGFESFAMTRGLPPKPTSYGVDGAEPATCLQGGRSCTMSRRSFKVLA